MIYVNEDIAKKFPEADYGYTYELKNVSGKKALAISKRLDGGLVSNSVETEFVRIFVQGNGNCNINVERVDIYKFGGTKFIRGNGINANIVKFPINANFNGNGFVDVPVFVCDEAFEIIFSSNAAKIYTAINGTIHNISKDILEKYNKLGKNK